MARIYFLFIFIFGLALSFGGFVSQAAGAPERVIVTFDHAVNESARAALENSGGRILKELPLINGAAVLLPNEAAVSAVSALAGVRAVEKDARVFALKPPSSCSPWPDCKNDGDTTTPPPPSQTLEWGVDRIDADLAWGESRGNGVKVAVIDTGIDKNHPDLIANLKGGINFISRGGPPWNPKPADSTAWDDDNGHGTHVAGIIAAVDNDQGVIGTAPGAYLYGVKVLDKTGSGYTSDVIAGINWAIDNGMQVINMSLGSDNDVQSLHDAVDAAYNAGVVVVAAAGNSGDGNAATNEVSYPAKYSSVIAVAAIASDNSVPYWSSDGGEVELAAPGVGIRSTWNDGSYNIISGTSMATPHVAGTVALVIAAPARADYDLNSNGVWDPSEVRAALKATADDFGANGHDNFYGYGIVDAEESVAE